MWNQRLLHISLILNFLMLLQSMVEVAEGTLDTQQCYRDKRDHLPSHMRKVVQNPTDYILGPKSKMKSKQLKVVIVGAGMSGLLSAYLLRKAGHEVALIEGSDRIGGRVYTRYGNGYYGDIGAMRFPPQHVLVYELFKIFNIPLTDFTNYNQGDKGNYYYINHRYLQQTDLKKQKVLSWLYKSFNVPENKVPKDSKGMVMNPVTIIDKYLEVEMQNKASCKNDESLISFLSKKCKQDGYHQNIIHIWSILTVKSSMLPYSVREWMKDFDEEYMIAKAKGARWQEVVNGTSLLPYAIFDKLKEESDNLFHPFVNSRVFKIDNSKKYRAKVYFRELDKEPRSEEADLVIMATTAPAVNLIDFIKPLPLWKRLALDRLKYINSNKIVLKFKKPFWSHWNNNKAHSIAYGTPRGKQRFGGTGITDNILEQIYYPSNTNHGPTLMASYTWDNNADLWLSMNESAAINEALSKLELIHGPVVREEFEEGFSYNWMTNEFSHGGFVQYQSFQQYSYQDTLMRPVGNILFVGEYTNKHYPGWIEAALESSVRNLINLSPKAFNKDFAEEEQRYLNNEERPYSKNAQ